MKAPSFARRHLSRPIPVASVVGWLALASDAYADHETLMPVPEGPYPLSLPDLTHVRGTAGVESTYGFLSVNEPTTGGARKSAISVHHLAVEVPVGNRHFFVGSSYNLLKGNDTLNTLLGGNLEISGRAVWATRTGMSSGGGLSLLLPTASFTRQGSPSDVATSAATVRPWERSFFRPDAATARPFFDLRLVLSDFALQFRQVMDLSGATSDLSQYELTFVTTLYAGFQASTLLSFGVESIEVYAVDAPITDEQQRSQFVLSPLVRLDAGRVQSTFGVLKSFGSPIRTVANVGAPLLPTTYDFWAARVAISYTFGR